jgi:hypothetical protein
LPAGFCPAAFLCPLGRACLKNKTKIGMKKMRDFKRKQEKTKGFSLQIDFLPKND